MRLRSVVVRRRMPSGTRRQPLGRVAADPVLRDWLLHADSLTARIRACTPDFAVQVLRQGPVRIRPHELRAGLRPGVVHAREVLLLADGVPVVWARTVLPRRGLTGSWHFLRGLGARPLGARLFTDPRIRRERFLHLARSQCTQRPALRLPVLAGRSARLLRGGTPAILTEVLLCGLLQLRALQPV